MLQMTETLRNRMNLIGWCAYSYTVHFGHIKKLPRALGVWEIGQRLPRIVQPPEMTVSILDRYWAKYRRRSERSFQKLS